MDSGYAVHTEKSAGARYAAACIPYNYNCKPMDGCRSCPERDAGCRVCCAYRKIGGGQVCSRLHTLQLLGFGVVLLRRKNWP